MTKTRPVPQHRDIPSIELRPEHSYLRPLFEAVKETMQVGMGFRGDGGDRFVRERDLLKGGALESLLVAQGPVGSPTPGPPGPSGPPGPPTPYVPDLTPPPTATGLLVTAGLTHIFVECDEQIYSEGHGHDRTIIYGAKWPTSDPTPPTFSEAVAVKEFLGTVTSFQTDTGTRWCVWIKWQSVDGMKSTDPEGGTNGAQATTGRVGNADLNDLIVTSEKLSAGTYEGINLVRNPGAEDLAVAWMLDTATGLGGTFGYDSSQKASGTYSFQINKNSDGSQVSATCRAFPVIPGETYSVKIKIRGNAAGGSFAVRMQEMAAAPGTGYVRAVDYETAQTVISTARTTAFVSHEVTYTPTAGKYWVSLSVIDVGNGSNGTQIWFDDVAVGRQITASHLAAGSIAVGSAAIANGAISNAMLGNAVVDTAKIADASIVTAKIGDAAVVTAKINDLAVTTAKIANAAITNAKINDLSADKITAGTLDVGRLAAGSITADRLRIGTGAFAINPDPYFTDSTVWPTAGVGSGIINASAFPGGKCYYAADERHVFGPQIPIDPLRTFHLSMRAASANGSRRFYLAAMFLDGNGALITGSSDPQGWAGGTYHYYGLVNDLAPNYPSVGYYETMFGAGAPRGIPSNARYVRLGCLMNYANVGSGDGYWGAVVLRDASTGVHIADGAITAQKIVAGTITTDRIQIGACTANVQGSYSSGAVSLSSGATSHTMAGVATSSITATGGIVVSRFKGHIQLRCAAGTPVTQCQFVVDVLVNGSIVESVMVTPGKLDTPLSDLLQATWSWQTYHAASASTFNYAFNCTVNANAAFGSSATLTFRNQSVLQEFKV